MAKPMQMKGSVVRTTLRPQIRAAEKEGTITFTAQEFKQLIIALEKNVRHKVSSAYTAGYING